MQVLFTISISMEGRNRVQGYRCETASQYDWFGWVSAFHLGPRSPLEPRSACGAHCRARLVSSLTGVGLNH